MMVAEVMLMRMQVLPTNGSDAFAWYPICWPVSKAGTATNLAA